MRLRSVVGLMTLAMFTTASCMTTQLKTRTQNIKVTTEPSGALIWRGDDTGQKTVGNSPVSVALDYQERISEFNSSWWWALGTSAGVTAIGGLFLGLGPGTGMDDAIYKSTGYSALALGGLALIISGIATIYGKGREGETTGVSTPAVIGARLDGYQPKKMELTLPSRKGEINLLLQPASAPAMGTPTTGAVASGESAPQAAAAIVAVFDVHDATGRMDKKTLVQLTNYLSTVLAQTGQYKTIPRNQLRARLLEEKKGTYKTCYDESCQIELGKAVAAQKTLATTLIRVGSKCAVTANLFDLKTETVEKGATANTGCSPDELLDAMKQVTQQLAS